MRRGLTVAALALLVLIVAAVAGLMALNTDPGRAFLTRQLPRLIAPKSGLRIGIGRIDGSLYGRATLHDLTFSDPKGVFVRVPVAELDWRPGWLTAKRVEVNSLAAPEVDWLRLPKLEKTEAGGPILPNIDIRIRALRLDRIVAEPPVAGRRHVATLSGRADIKSGRALIDATARVLDGGDRLALKLDAAPDRDRFDIDARVAAPAPGLLTGLLGLAKPLDLTVAGDGKWSDWRGHADATVGKQALMALTVTGRDGKFALKGRVAPALVAGGMAARLTSEGLNVDATAALANRRVETRVALLSREVRANAGGVLDLAKGDYDGFRVDALLLRPEALLIGARLADAKLHMDLSGPLARPAVDFTAATPRLAVSTTILERLRITGRADTARHPLAVPVTATVGRVLGLGPDLQSILTNVRVMGPVVVTGLKLTSNALTLASDKLAGRAILSFDLATGRYDIGITGGVARYLVPGVGIVDIATDLRVIPNPGGSPRLSGKATAIVRRLDNGFFRSLMEGLPTITSDIDLPPDGSIQFRNLRLRSLALTLAGQGFRTKEGAFRIQTAGAATRYGPLTVGIDGVLPTPRVALALARPDFGIGLAGVRGQLIPNGAGWDFTAAGASDYGPASARGALVVRGSDPLIIRVADLRALGSAAHGDLRAQGSALAGTLAVDGGGIAGALRFAPSGDIQRIDADLRLDRARLPSSPPISVGKGTLAGTVLMTPGAPTLTGKFVAANVRRGALTLTSADLDLDYRAGRGRVTGKLAGRQGVGFALDGGIGFRPDALTVTAKGTIDRQAVALTTPAVVTRVAGGWKLAPVKLNVSGGSAVIGGSFGAAQSVDAKLDGIGLGLLDLFYPGLGLGGTISGTANAIIPADGGLPRGRVNLRIARFTRAGAATISLPVDLGVNGVIDGNAAAMRAVVMRGGTVLGRAQGQLRPIPGRPSDPWKERLLSAPLAAQLRFNGPADAVWPLLAIRAFDVRGPLGISADVGGHLGDPTIAGRMTSSGLRFESAVLGTTVEDLKLDSRFSGARLEFASLSGTAGKGGTITGSGSVDLSAERGFPIDMKFQATNAQVLRRDDLRATATGPIHITSDKNGGLVQGKLVIDKAQFRIGRPVQEVVPELIVRESGGDLSAPGSAPVKPVIWKLDIAADANNKVMVTGMGLDTEWSAKLKIGGQADTPSIVGTADYIRGGYEFAGKRFDLTRGHLRFTGGYPPDPIVDIVAAANVTGVTATIAITGTGLRPEIAFSSVPALPEDEVLSRVLFGSSVTNLSAPEALQLASAVNSLRTGGGKGGFDVFRLVRKGLGIDRLRVLPGDTTKNRGTSVAAGEYIGDRVYVEVASDAAGYTATQIEVALTRSLSILSQIATSGGNSVNLKWSKDY